MRKALGRNLILFAVALVAILAAVVVERSRAEPAVQVVTATVGGAGAAPVAGAVSVTANGYVVARTKASVSAKTPGRFIHLAENTETGGRLLSAGGASWSPFYG